MGTRPGSRTFRIRRISSAPIAVSLRPDPTTQVQVSSSGLSGDSATVPRLDIPRSYLSRGFGRFVGEKVGELFGEAVGGATS